MDVMKGEAMNQGNVYRKANKIVKFLCVFLVGMGFMLSVHMSQAQEISQKRIAVMPFIKGKHPESIEETMTCPYSSFCFEEESLKEGADKILTRLLQAMVNKNFHGQAIPMEQTAQAFEILKFDHVKDTPEAVLLKLGEMLNVDYMMAGNIWRYKERVGTSFSVERPASVAFAVYLVDVKSKELIWKDSYDETQQALLENLFNIKDFFKQGFKWLTAEELARFGMNKMFDDFPLKQ
jgi:TolB-like protein